VANVWFSADFHLGHSNIIRYCDRPFGSAAEMDEAILDRVNESVKAADELYFLGDFCIGGPKVAAAYRQKIRCKKVYFILGNHDRVIKRIVDQFVWVKEIAEVNIRNQPIVLCHYAMRVWHHSAVALGNYTAIRTANFQPPRAVEAWMSASTRTSFARIHLTRSERNCPPKRLTVAHLILRARSR
jgi:calcineurin-like phosphoesterase family protein